jgi:hypothetical protein
MIDFNSSDKSTFSLFLTSASVSVSTSNAESSISILMNSVLSLKSLVVSIPSKLEAKETKGDVALREHRRGVKVSEDFLDEQGVMSEERRMT